MAEIQKTRGRVEYNWTYNNGKYIPNGRPWAPHRLVQFLGIDYFGHVTSVSLRQTDQQTIAHVGKLKQVERLYFFGDSKFSPDLADLEGLTELTDLNFGSTPVNDAGLAHLQRMTKLLELKIWDAPRHRCRLGTPERHEPALETPPLEQIPEQTNHRRRNGVSERLDQPH